MIHITEKKLRAAIYIALFDECENIDKIEAKLVHDIKGLSMTNFDDKFTDQIKNIDLAYLTGVFNVVGIDGLQKELTRLKEIGKNPHEILTGSNL